MNSRTYQVACLVATVAALQVRDDSAFAESAKDHYMDAAVVDDFTETALEELTKIKNDSARHTATAAAAVNAVSEKWNELTAEDKKSMKNVQAMADETFAALKSDLRIWWGDSYAETPGAPAQIASDDGTQAGDGDGVNDAPNNDSPTNDAPNNETPAGLFVGGA